MYPLAKFGGHRPYRNININSYINSFMSTLEKAKLTASIPDIARSFESGIPIFCSEVPEKAGEKREEEKHMQWQRVLRFAQTQNITRKALYFLSKRKNSDVIAGPRAPVPANSRTRKKIS